MSLVGLDREEIGELVRELGEPPYRAAQLFDWVQKKGASDYDAMSNLPKATRSRLAERMPVRSTRVIERHASEDDTVKLLVELRDGQRVECVLIPEGERATACISTQVGCGVGCIFCASGADGVIRNLDAAEILEQVHHLEEEAARRSQEPGEGDDRPSDHRSGRLTNVVVMGMGEPLHNVEPLVKALRILQHPEGIDLGSRRITVSTSGPTRGFEEFIKSGLRVKLAISLHAASDSIRSNLVPRGGSPGVSGLRRMAERWFEQTRRDVTFEYVLIHGLNDSDREAERLAEVCGQHFNVNLIPMNPVEFAPALRAPSRDRTERFAKLLEARGIVVHLRRQRGDDVAAACGQLRLSREQGA